MSRSTRPQTRPVGPLVLIGVGLTLLIGAILISLGLSPTPTVPTAPLQDSAEDTFPEIPRVSLADARTAFDAQSAVFVDVREPDPYTAGHIPGARSLPLAELESRLGELSRSDWIITYCT